MNPTIDPSLSVRVANFSDITLPCEHQLSFDGEGPAAIVRKIRTYADIPYIYVVSKQRADQVAPLLSELKAIRSPCFPYALICIDGADVDFQDPDLEVIPFASTDPDAICSRIKEFAAGRFRFDESRLQTANTGPLPKSVDVAIVGAGITGLYAAGRLQEAGLSFCILEKQGRVGGIWCRFANHTSQVNSSESAYRLIEKKSRSNRDHSATREILEDIARLSEAVSSGLFTGSEVERIDAGQSRYRITVTRGGERVALESKGVILAINDRVGTPREIKWTNQQAFRGTIVSGISNDAAGLDWRDKKVVIVGMGAFAVENARTALIGGARHVTVVGRRHGTVCPKIIDYLNFATPYDEQFLHDKKSNLMNMMYWKKLYDLSGATQPECWMGKIKHDGHTISVSDIWFIGHHLKKIETVTGEISTLTESGVVVNEGQRIDADIVVNCVGFERNAPVVKKLCGYEQVYNNNYLAKDFMYLADAFIDSNAFNSLFGSSVLEMVKFYMEVFIHFFDSPEYEAMTATEGIEKLPVEDRQWSHYIKAAMALIRRYPAIHEIARRQVDRRTSNFLQIHDLPAYIAENKREWIDTHTVLAGRPVREEDCLPYVFEKLLP